MIEDKYSRKNIRQLVYNDVLNSAFGSLESPFLKATEIVKTYLNKKYYRSKQMRVQALQKAMLPLDIIIEIFISVFANKHATPIQAIAGQLANTLKFNDLFDGVKTASELLALLEPSKAYVIIRAANSETGSILIRSNFLFSAATREFIEQSKYLPPLICPPKQLTTNKENGYLTHDESVILGRGNHHDGNQSLDVLNILSAIPLCIDENMLQYEEALKKPKHFMEHVDELMRAENHAWLVAASKVVYKELLEEGNTFYFTWKNDKRGRLYSQGYHVNIQSTDYKKALISLKQKHVITGN